MWTDLQIYNGFVSLKLSIFYELILKNKYRILNVINLNKLSNEIGGLKKRAYSL